MNLPYLLSKRLHSRCKMLYGLLYGMAIGLLMVIFVLLADGMAHPASAGSEQLSPQRPGLEHAAAVRAVVDRARNAWMQGDADAFAALFTDQGELIVPGQRWIGAKQIRQVAADFAAQSSNVTVDIRRVIVEGNHAAVEWHWEDTVKATGYRNRADDAIAIDFVNGKISRWREYIDTQTPSIATVETVEARECGGCAPSQRFHPCTPSYLTLRWL